MNETKTYSIFPWLLNDQPENDLSKYTHERNISINVLPKM